MPFAASSPSEGYFVLPDGSETLFGLFRRIPSASLILSDLSALPPFPGSGLSSVFYLYSGGSTPVRLPQSQDDLIAGNRSKAYVRKRLCACP